MVIRTKTDLQRMLIVLQLQGPLLAGAIALDLVGVVIILQVTKAVVIAVTDLVEVVQDRAEVVAMVQVEVLAQVGVDLIPLVAEARDQAGAQAAVDVLRQEVVGAVVLRGLQEAGDNTESRSRSLDPAQFLRFY